MGASGPVLWGTVSRLELGKSKPDYVKGRGTCRLGKEADRTEKE